MFFNEVTFDLLKSLKEIRLIYSQITLNIHFSAPFILVLPEESIEGAQWIKVLATKNDDLNSVLEFT